jgi:hypothetical protein
MTKWSWRSGRLWKSKVQASNNDRRPQPRGSVGLEPTRSATRREGFGRRPRQHNQAQLRLRQLPRVNQVRGSLSAEVGFDLSSLLACHMRPTSGPCQTLLEAGAAPVPLNCSRAPITRFCARRVGGRTNSPISFGPRRADHQRRKPNTRVPTTSGCRSTLVRTR